MLSMKKPANEKSEIAQFIFLARSRLKMTQDQFGEMLNFTKANVSAWENGRHLPKLDVLLDISKKSGLPIPGVTIGGDLPDIPEVSIATSLFKRRPLLNSVTAGGFREAIDNIHPDEAEMIAPITANGGPSSAWLRIENDSMEDRFKEGDLILVDPDKQWGHGDFVVAANGDGHWTFKQLIRDGIDWYLKPLNPTYPLRRVDEHIVIIGKAIEHQPQAHKL